MKRIVILASIVLTALACKNEGRSENTELPAQENNKENTAANPVLTPGCYAYNKNGNTVTMEITQVDENVKGTLDIAYAEKDANSGSFAGELKGDKLLATFTFNSEGKESERDIAFLVKNGQLIEGYGAMNENGTRFKNNDSLEYSSTMPLSKVDCAR